MYYQPPPQPAYYGPQYSGCVKFLLYALSFFIPLAGVIIGVIFLSRPDPESKGMGQACLILGIVSFVLTCCLTVAASALGFLPFLTIPFMEEFNY
ncbi:MAG: hypothetical protein JXD18_02185 [Anaerolineae bacterium]|nr:hypothetical protein [Anaerolineae bacterium]